MVVPDLVFAQLCELYFFENQLVGGLERLADASSDPELEALFRNHRVETLGQVKRLEQAFAALHEIPKAFPTLTVDGLMQDARWLIHTTEKGPARDAALMAAARRTEALETVLYDNLIHSAGGQPL
jgi:ferritin-like metal-binding protein YciE